MSRRQKHKPMSVGETSPHGHSRYHLRSTHRPKSSYSDTDFKPKDTRYLAKEYRLNVPKPRYAYITLVMCGDEYSKGALTLAWSLRQQNTQHELVVMTTPDVSVRVLKLLRKLFDRVLRISYIENKANCRLRGKRYREENRWINQSLTKARMLKLAEYDKLIWLDADMLVIENIDALFDVPAPAGICSSVRDHNYWHGLKLPETEVENSVLNNYGIYGCVMVLEPNLDHYLLASTQPIIGDKGTFVGPDDFFFTQLYKREWHHIHVKYGCSRWHAERLSINPAVVHYVGAKPWEGGGGDQEWQGLWQWRAAVEHMVTECRVMAAHFTEERIKERVLRPKSAMPLLRMLTDE